MEKIKKRLSKNDINEEIIFVSPFSYILIIPSD